MRHLLVTNDFPPKVGGIQAYLWELWRRLPPENVTVLTTPHRDAAAFDRHQAFRVVRTRQRWLLPTGVLRKQIDELAREVGAELIVLDPILPLGLIGPRLELPYITVAHGAELVIPGKLPVTRSFAKRVVSQARGSVAGGEYVARATRHLASVTSSPVEVIPPGVDVNTFVPATPEARSRARSKWGIDDNTILIGGISRLVPRKGFDRLIKATAELEKRGRNVKVLVAGKGRDRARLERLVIKHKAPVRLLGRISDEDLRDLYAAMDVFCMPCHDRWLGLEQEGFGIVFVEASSCGLPVVAGNSGGSGEAVMHEATGFVVGGSVGWREVANDLDRLVVDGDLRHRLGAEGRRRMEHELDYDLLATRLEKFIDSCASTGG